MKRRQELNPKQKERAEKYGKNKGGVKKDGEKKEKREWQGPRCPKVRVKSALHCAICGPREANAPSISRAGGTCEPSKVRARACLRWKVRLLLLHWILLACGALSPVWMPSFSAQAVDHHATQASCLFACMHFLLSGA